MIFRSLLKIRGKKFSQQFLNADHVVGVGGGGGGGGGAVKAIEYEGFMIPLTFTLNNSPGLFCFIILTCWSEIIN